jgi:hypothetical protein
MEQELKMAEIMMKEKDSECKLTEMKIKELRRQVPSTKLKPLAIGYTGLAKHKVRESSKSNPFIT